MTYAGPPNRASQNRNKNRKDYSRASFDFGYTMAGEDMKHGRNNIDRDNQAVGIRYRP